MAIANVYPNASAVVRGLVSTGAQTFAGAKTFTSVLTVRGASGGYRMFNQATDALSSEWFSPTAGETRLYDHASGVVRLTINSSGWAGIGETSPGTSASQHRRSRHQRADCQTRCLSI